MQYNVVNGHALLVLNTLRDCGLGAVGYRLKPTTTKLGSGHLRYAASTILRSKVIRHYRAYGIISGNVYSGRKALGVIVRLWRVNPNGTICRISTLYLYRSPRSASRI